MPKVSPFRDKALKAKAIKLYKEGLTLREVSKIVQRSHTWVWEVVRNAGLLPNPALDEPSG